MRNKKTDTADYQTVINVLEEDYAGKSFPLGGKIWKSGDLVTAFQAAITAISGANADKITWQTSVAKQQAAGALARTLFVALKGYIAVIDGKQSTAYKTFGFAPVPATPTPEAKVAAGKKIAATRSALGTRGKRQRVALKRALATAATSAPGTGGSSGNGGSGGSGSGNGSNGAAH
jgi:hypothetical protein